MTLPLRGRTTRLILSALVKLSEGRNIIFVAHPRAKAVAICRRAVSIARGLKIPCRNIRSDDGANEDAPWIRPREFGAEIPMPAPNAEVFIDHSACFERGSVRPADECIITNATNATNTEVQHSASSPGASNVAAATDAAVDESRRGNLTTVNSL